MWSVSIHALTLDVPYELDQGFLNSVIQLKHHQECFLKPWFGDPLLGFCLSRRLDLRPAWTLQYPSSSPQPLGTLGVRCWAGGGGSRPLGTGAGRG